MRGIILAAGRGSRMKSATANLPKCRTKFKGKALIEWQLDAFRGADILDVAIVVGYLKDTFNYNTTYFENNRWSETNMVQSLISASEWLYESDCIISYSDIVYSRKPLEILSNTADDLAITYDPNWEVLWRMRFEDPLSDAESFRFSKNELIEIGSKVDSISDIEGQYMGLIKISPAGWEKVTNLLRTMESKTLDKLDMTSLLQKLLSNGVKIGAYPVYDKWYEIDSQSDLAIYEQNLSNTDDIFSI